MFTPISSTFVNSSKSLLSVPTAPVATGFEASCGEGEHIIAFNLRPAKHLELNSGNVTNASGKRNSTYLTVTAGSVMITEKDQPFLKSKILVSAFLYKGGRYIEPPAYTQSSTGVWELHPKASCTGLSALVYGIWLKDTNEALVTFANELDKAVNQYNYCQSIPGLIESLEGCITTGDYAAFEDKGITSEEQANEAIANLQADYGNITSELPKLEEQYNKLTTLCENLTQQLADKTYWRSMVEKIQETVNLVGLCNEDIKDAFGELKESKTGLLLKCRVKIVYDYLNTFEIKLVCLDSKIEPGNLGSAVTGTIVSQKDSTNLLQHTAAHLKSLSEANKAAEAEARMKSWSNTTTQGNKKNQALNLYQGSKKNQEANSKKVVNRAVQKEDEVKVSIEKAKKEGDIETLETLQSTLTSIQARISELNNQKAATTPLPEVEVKAEEEEFDGNMVM